LERNVELLRHNSVAVAGNFEPDTAVTASPADPGYSNPLLVKREPPKPTLEQQLKFYTPIVCGAVALSMFGFVLVRAMLAPPMSPSQRQEATEQLLNLTSHLSVLDAVARRDESALREELKLLELRRIRRNNQ
jgi:hypothetical protein